MTAKPKKIKVSKTPLSEQLHRAQSSALERYQQKALGSTNFGYLLQYELVNLLFNNLGGALGYQMRKWFYKPLFGAMGSGVIFGRGLTLRHPNRIELGHGVAIDDYVMLDASGAGESGVRIDDNVILSRNCVVQGKTGFVHIGQHTDIGCNTVITSATAISIGQFVLMGANCYIGGGRYHADKLDVPIMKQGIYSRGPISIGNGVWLGANVIVLDGVQIGHGCIVGAGAVVTQDLPAESVALGVPARVIKNRRKA